MVKKSFNELLQQREYIQCIRIVKEKIINHVVNLIKEYEPTYEYTSIEDLIMLSNKYLTTREKYIAELIEQNTYEEEELEELERLLEICEKFNIRET